MKKILTTILCAAMISLGCASPVPQSPIELSWEPSPDEALGSSYVVYAMPAGPGANWAQLTNVPTASHAIILDAPAYGTRYTVTLLGENGESPMSNVVTNFNLNAPGVLKIHR